MSNTTTTDTELEANFAAMVSFELTPNQPVDADIDPRLRYTSQQSTKDLH